MSDESPVAPCDNCGTPVTDDDAWTATFHDDTPPKRLCATCAQAWQEAVEALKALNARAATTEPSGELLCPNCGEPADVDEVEDEKADLTLCSECGAGTTDPWMLQTLECPSCSDTLYTCPTCREWSTMDETIDDAFTCPACEQASPAEKWQPAEDAERMSI